MSCVTFLLIGVVEGFLHDSEAQGCSSRVPQRHRSPQQWFIQRLCSNFVYNFVTILFMAGAAQPFHLSSRWQELHNHFTFP